jgi:hypothetical protein
MPVYVLRITATKLIVSAGEQGGTFGDQQSAERVGDDLLGTPVAGAACPCAPPAPSGCRIERNHDNRTPMRDPCWFA